MRRWWICFPLVLAGCAPKDRSAPLEAALSPPTVAEAASEFDLKEFAAAVGDAYRNASYLAFTAQVSGSQVTEPLICEVFHTPSLVQLDVFGEGHRPLYSFRSFQKGGEVFVEEKNFRTGQSRNEVVGLAEFQYGRGWDIECIDDIDFCSIGAYWRTWVGPASVLADDIEQYLSNESEYLGRRLIHGRWCRLFLWRHHRGFFTEWILVDESTHLVVERLRPDPNGAGYLRHRVFHYHKLEKGEFPSPTDPDFALDVPTGDAP